MGVKTSGSFVKGDARINRKGRPKNFTALRELAQEIAHEVARTKDGDPLVINGNALSVVQAMMRKWATSNNPALQQKFIAIAFGEVPQETRLAGHDGNELVITVRREKASGNSSAGTTQRADDGDEPIA